MEYSNYWKIITSVCNLPVNNYNIDYAYDKHPIRYNYSWTDNPWDYYYVNPKKRPSPSGSIDAAKCAVFYDTLPMCLRNDRNVIFFSRLKKLSLFLFGISCILTVGYTLIEFVI